MHTKKRSPSGRQSLFLGMRLWVSECDYFFFSFFLYQPLQNETARRETVFERAWKILYIETPHGSLGIIRYRMNSKKGEFVNDLTENEGDAHKRLGLL